MSKLVAVSLIIYFFLTCLPCQAADKSSTEPKFKDYIATEEYTGKPALVDFSSDPTSKKFKTVLSNGIKQGVNFAGAYTIVSWGCGTNCALSAILETKTGKICAKFGSCRGEEYKKDSKLLIINPADTERDYYLKGCDTMYYVWNGKDLEEIKVKR